MRPQNIGVADVPSANDAAGDIPAAHAFAAERGLFSKIETIDAPDSWATLFADDAKPTRFADVVHNAWRFYDWTDFLKL